jgi:hypothetical protein
MEDPQKHQKNYSMNSFHMWKRLRESGNAVSKTIVTVELLCRSSQMLLIGLLVKSP